MWHSNRLTKSAFGTCSFLPSTCPGLNFSFTLQLKSFIYCLRSKKKITMIIFGCMAKIHGNEIHLSSDKCLECDMCKIIIPYQLHVESDFFFIFTKSLTFVLGFNPYGNFSECEKHIHLGSHVNSFEVDGGQKGINIVSITKRQLFVLSKFLLSRR